MPASRLEYLFKCYVQRNCSVEEEEELMVLLCQTGNEPAVQSLINTLIETTGSEMQMSEQAAVSILQNILQSDKTLKTYAKNKKIDFIPWIRAAAVAILFIAGASYLVFSKKNNQKDGNEKHAKKYSPILPGGDKALLTLSDGSTVILDSMQNGVLQNGGTKINMQGGSLIYAATPVAGEAVVYNTLSTPRGGQYQVILPDGSKVWLNAASSLHYPTAFAGSQRDVELIGEAYFEVAKDKSKPFRVKVGDMQVNVLGTHFNVSAYQDEKDIKTSLLEGSVKITRGKEKGMLEPGQQAVMNMGEDKIEIVNADMGEVMAWKNGYFQFNNASLQNVLRQISRWYDVDIVYEGNNRPRKFVGEMQRDLNLSEMLKILETNQVQFKIVGKELRVMPD
jgi:hypothetical protein